jgi:glucose-6-phosphate 1-dehydrogenase
MKTTWIVIGAAGDLAQNKIIPAFAALGDEHYYELIAVDLHDAHGVLPPPVAQRTRWIIGDATGADLYYDLAQSVSDRDVVFIYCATEPSLYCTIFCHARDAGLINRRLPLRSIIFEKPYGTDYESAHMLMHSTAQSLDPQQVLCIDHYRARAVVAALETVRFANGFFRSFWSRASIASMHIVLSESARIQSSFYDTYGVLGDVMQNHVLQLLALMTMAEPEEDTSISRLSAVCAIYESFSVEALCEGRYRGYADDIGVLGPHNGSYALMRCSLDTPVWCGVRIYCEAGKALADKYTLVRIKLHSFRGQPANECLIRIVPDEGFLLTVSVLNPAGTHRVPLTLNGCYDCLAPAGSPAAYERFIRDLIAGHRSGVGIVSPQELLMQWQIIDTIRMHRTVFHEYLPGSIRPQAAYALLGSDA